MSSRKADRWVFVLMLAVIGVSMLALNVHTPLMMDDYDYSFSWATGERLAGVGDILASQAAHYRLWGGRSVVHFLAQLFLYLGKPVFNLANAAMYVLLLLEIYALVRRRESAWDARILLAAHLLLMTTVSFFGTVFLWLDGACNYLWGTALALLPLLIARSEREGGVFDAGWARGVIALPVCFLAGWTNENTACGVLAVIFLLMIWDRIKGRKVRAWRVAAFAAQALGVAVMLLAPGNFARAGGETSRGMVMELLYRFAVVSYCLLRHAGVVIVLALAAMLVARRRRVSLRAEWLCVLGACAFLGSYALVGSPQISDRTFTGVIALLIALLLTVVTDLKPRADGHSVRLCAALFCLTAVVTVCALRDVKAHEAAWQTQENAILAAAAAGEREAGVASVPSVSRFTMSIALEESTDAWPNSTLGRYYGVAVRGQ